MTIKWREQLERSPRLRDINTWPNCDSLLDDPKKRKGFIKNRTIVDKVLQRMPIKEVAKLFNLSNSAISQKLARCLQSEENDEPLLTLGLIPDKHCKPFKRRLPLATFNQCTGNTGAFTQLLLDRPSLRDSLNEFIADCVLDTPYSQKFSIKAVFGEFKRLLKQLNVPTSSYPYTVESMAYESIRKYAHMHHFHVLNERQRQAFDGAIKPNQFHAFRQIEIDAQNIDVHARLELDNSFDLPPVRISKIWVYVAIDFDTDSILGFHVSFEMEPQVDDIMALFTNILTGYKPRTSCPDSLRIHDRYSFPCDLPGFENRALIGTVSMDNAKIHHALSIRELVTKKLGATYHLGIPSQPLVRATVENAIQSINEFTHRVNSTKGSHPRDENTESPKHAKKVPVFNLLDLEHALHRAFSRYNNARSAKQNMYSKLDLFAYHLQNKLIGLAPFPYQTFLDSSHTTEIVRLHKKKKSVPYISIFSFKYYIRCPINPRLFNKQVRVEYSRNDIRYLRITSLDGVQIGVATAPSKWMKYPLTLMVRRLLKKQERKVNKSKDDPFAEFFYDLKNQNLPEPKITIAAAHVISSINGEASSLRDKSVDKTNRPQAQIYPTALMGYDESAAIERFTVIKRESDE